MVPVRAQSRSHARRHNQPAAGPMGVEVPDDQSGDPAVDRPVGVAGCLLRAQDAIDQLIAGASAVARPVHELVGGHQGRELECKAHRKSCSGTSYSSPVLGKSCSGTARPHDNTTLGP